VGRGRPPPPLSWGKPLPGVPDHDPPGDLGAARGVPGPARLSGKQVNVPTDECFCNQVRLFESLGTLYVDHFYVGSISVHTGVASSALNLIGHNE